MAKAIHTMIRVLDEERSVDFYGKALGLKVADRFPFDGFTLVYLRNSEADFEVELTVNHSQTESYSHGDGYGHLAVAVDDIEAEHARFKEVGLEPKDVVEFHRDFTDGASRLLTTLAQRVLDHESRRCHPGNLGS